MKIEDEEIRTCLIASVKEGLESVDGGLVSAFHANLEASGLTEADIPDELEILCSVLEKTFGMGSFTVRRAIAKVFYSKLSLPFEPFVGKKLSRYIAEARELRETH